MRVVENPALHIVYEPGANLHGVKAEVHLAKAEAERLAKEAPGLRVTIYSPTQTVMFVAGKMIWSD